MTREITSHKVNGLNEALTVSADDERGAGNANHEYSIYGGEVKLGPNEGTDARGTIDERIRFQNGPVNEAGINGVSNEALLAIVADRLEGFQAGVYSCQENALALQKIQGALDWLKRRTKDRAARGVEGTSKK